MRVFDRVFRASRRGYFKYLVLVPGMGAGVCAGAAGLAYFLLGIRAVTTSMARLGVAYLALVTFVGALDAIVCRFAYRPIRRFLRGAETPDRDALLRQVVRFPVTAAFRILAFNQIVGLGLVVAIAWLIDAYVDMVHLCVGVQVAIFVHVLAGYLAARAVAEPIFDALGAERIPDSALQAGWLARKFVWIYGTVGVVPFLLIAAFIGRRTGEFPTVVLAIAAVSTLISLGLTLWLGRSITRPIREMVESMRAVGKGDYSTRVHVYADDDVALLANAFNRMLADLEASTAALHARNEELRRWSETLEQRVAERGRELEQTKAIALHNEKLAALGTLLSGVGHELNNPLSQIQRNASNLQRDLAPVLESLAEARALLAGGVNGDAAQAWLDRTERLRLERRLPFMAEAVANITRGGERSLSLVRSLNVFSRSSDDPPRRLALRGLAEEAVNLLRSDARSKGVEFRIDIPPDFEAVVFEQPLLQVLLNLGQNAALAIRDGAGAGGGVVEVSARPEGEHVVLAVADTGPGIPEALLPRIFTPFFTTRPQGEGSGLGLAIVQNIVTEMHSGEVQARNRSDGRGAVFEVRIPVRLDAICARAAREKAPLARAPSTTP